MQTTYRCEKWVSLSEDMMEILKRKWLLVAGWSQGLATHRLQLICRPWSLAYMWHVNAPSLYNDRPSMYVIFYCLSVGEGPTVRTKIWRGTYPSWQHGSMDLLRTSIQRMGAAAVSVSCLCLWLHPSAPAVDGVVRLPLLSAFRWHKNFKLKNSLVGLWKIGPVFEERSWRSRTRRRIRISETVESFGDGVGAVCWVPVFLLILMLEFFFGGGGSCGVVAE